MSEQAGASASPTAAPGAVAEAIWEAAPPRPWQRAWATVYDMLAFTIGGMAVLTTLIWMFSPATAHALDALSDDNAERYAWWFIAGLVAVPLMAFFLSEFGATPGKWVFGIRLERMDGGPLDYPLMLRRELMMLFLGYGANLGIVTLGAGFWARAILLKTGQTKWDAACGTRVLYREHSIYRITIGLSALWCLFIVAYALPN